MKHTVFCTLFVLFCTLVTIPVQGKEKMLPYKNLSLPIEERVSDLLKRMTLEEKVAQLQHIHSYLLFEGDEFSITKLEELMGDKSMGCVEGITLPGKKCAEVMHAIQRYAVEKTRLGIPIFTVTESLHGSVHDGSTIFPQAIALGSTFNTKLAYRMTSAIAEELKVQGIWQSLTPVLDVVRDLRWGRVEECFGEDPFLASRMGVNQVKGYLEHGISPMIKHFGAHGAPSGGLNLASVFCGEREMLSVYLKPFEAVIKEAKPWAVMSSYNSWNNEPNSSSSYLQTELLRNQWGFQGYMYSDWGAIGMLNYLHKTARNNAEAAAQALLSGLDVEASGNCYAELKGLVENGELDVKYIDLAVSRVLRAKFALGMFEQPYRNIKEYDKIVHCDEHVKLAREIAAESIVLMKNEGSLLPLDVDRISSIALIGPNAGQVQFGDYTWSRNNKDGVTLLSAMQTRYGDRLTINYAQGCDLVNNRREGFEEARTAALKSDVVVVVAGSASASLARDYSNATCGEGFDLSDLNLTGAQEELLKTIHATGKPVVFVLLSGKPFSIPWIKENIPAILVQWYPGEQGGNALADVLFGEVNPSGKLNYSFPQSVGHLPCYYNYLPTDKGFYKRPGSADKPGKDYVFSSPDALWAFGHGLSYTEFEYLSITTSKEDYRQDECIELIVKVKNSGNRDGKEVVQLYVRDLISSVVTPVHELKGFEKVYIKKGETVDVNITVPVSELAVYNRNMERVVEPGAFELQVGRASDDIHIRKVITVEKDKEKRVMTMKERDGETAPSNIRSFPLKVRGVVRDVQANLLSGIEVTCGKESVYTDKEGRFEIKGVSTENLVVGGEEFRQETIAINGRQVINVTLLRTE